MALTLPALQNLPSIDARARRRRQRRLDAQAIAAAALVNERYLDPRFTIPALARELRVPPLLLRARFRRFYRLPLDEHLALQRIELATLLMSAAPHRLGALEEIAHSSGYPDAGALDRDFQHYCRTPALAAWFRRGRTRVEPTIGTRA
ncbi:hypothetical protein GRS96_03235 [Rathayibacter sp. VKM Ac-2803]|uniref:hypothetical protein n=1 Tax=unclassified Rathayibacter TaxID=2609250 RepID=UPI001359331A|nr:MULTISPECIES: hypothetical protein [unclassified Rathayibacter]MWV48288.1 hypothetical protein [Rathayibacter sp. VKM Ac-2803]MWV59219.1 hypothetical protein [Rathayibacter sp. VKM Ac-2754]